MPLRSSGRRGTSVRGFFLLALFLLLSAQANATAIGVNRASIPFEDVLRGGFARSSVTVTTDSIEPIAAEIVLGEGEAAAWLNFSARAFSFSRDEPYTLTVEVRPPEDAAIAQYRVNMSVITGEIARSEGGKLGTATRASLGVPIVLTMTGNQIVRCKVGGVDIHDSAEGEPIEVEASIINSGNVRINPDISIVVHDKLRTQDLEERTAPFGSAILPTLTGTASRFFSLDLARSQYWASVSVPLCGYSGLHTFDVLAPGEVKDEGEFIRIDAASYARTGEIVPIKAVFRNKGERTVRAQFKGTIENEAEEIVKVIDTQAYLVGQGVTAELETFFNPSVGGQYFVKGKVFYNEKLTLEREAILNVGGPGILREGTSGTTFALLGLALAVLVLLVLIRRKKRPRIAHRR